MLQDRHTDSCVYKKENPIIGIVDTVYLQFLCYSFNFNALKNLINCKKANIMIGIVLNVSRVEIMIDKQGSC